MKKSVFIHTGLLVVMLTGISCRKQNQLPNIIYVLADDMGYGDVAALNPDGKISTPHLDRLVAEGMAFTDAHTTSAVCTPTRYGILTGRYNWRSTLKRGVLGGFAIRNGEWKLCLCPGSAGWSYPRDRDLENMQDYPPIQLFNLKEDIGEQQNLYDIYPEKVQELKSALKRSSMTDAALLGKNRPMRIWTNGRSWRRFSDTRPDPRD